MPCRAALLPGGPWPGALSATASHLVAGSPVSERLVRYSAKSVLFAEDVCGRTGRLAADVCEQGYGCGRGSSSILQNLAIGFTAMNYQIVTKTSEKWSWGELRDLGAVEGDSVL